MTEEDGTFHKIGDVVAKVVNDAVNEVSRRTPLTVCEKPSHRSDFKDLTGMRFGRFSVGEYAGKLGNHGAFWCTCDCGNIVAVRGYTLLNGDSQSCGCHRKETSRTSNISHGLYYTDHYGIHQGIKNRCYNSNVKAYPLCGGRGIKMCDRWLNGENGKSGIECFIEDVGPRPSKKHSIDRYPDPDGDYEPGNVRWATAAQQEENKSWKRVFTFRGESHNVHEWARRTGIPVKELNRRFGRGWPVEKILTQKMRVRPKNGK